jgi:hypothetical protein
MKIFLSIIAITSVISASALAEPSTKSKVTVRRESSVKMTSSSASLEMPHSHNSLNDGLSASFGIGSLSSRFHLGVLGRWETPSDVRGTLLGLGVETGFLFGPDSPTSFSIPILGIANYDLPNHGGLRAFIGIGLGVSINHASGVTTIAGDAGSDTRVKIAALLTPGVHLSEKVYFEMPLGSLGDYFTIIPSVGTHF